MSASSSAVGTPVGSRRTSRRRTGREGVSGILPALITPFDRDGSLDRAACRRLVDHVIAGGVDGVLVLGSSGEGAALDEAARHETVDLVTDIVAGRCPVVVGVIHSSLTTAVDDARHAATTGAAAVLVAPPYYGSVDQVTVAAFYQRLADAVDVPVMAYNIPAFTRVSIDPGTLRALAERGAIVGVKDSSRDFDYFQHVLVAAEDLPAFRVLTGTDSLVLPALTAGADGAVTIGANLVPAWCKGVRDAVAAGRWREAQSLQRQLVRLTTAIRRGPFPAGMKAALALVGLCGDTLAPPTRALTDAERSALAQDLRAIGLPAVAGT